MSSSENKFGRQLLVAIVLVVAVALLWGAFADAKTIKKSKSVPAATTALPVLGEIDKGEDDDLPPLRVSRVVGVPPLRTMKRDTFMCTPVGVMLTCIPTMEKQVRMGQFCPSGYETRILLAFSNGEWKETEFCFLESAPKSATSTKIDGDPGRFDCGEREGGNLVCRASNSVGQEVPLTQVCPTGYNPAGLLFRETGSRWIGGITCLVPHADDSK